MSSTLHDQVDHSKQPDQAAAAVDGSASRTPAQAWVRRWPVAVVLALLGVAVGIGWSTTIPVTYTAEARIAVGAGNLSSGAIAGFPLAAEQLASNYARYVNDRSLSGELSTAVTASPIPDSNIIRVEGVSTDQQTAVSATQVAATDLIDQVNSPRDSAPLQERYREAAQAWSVAVVEQQDAQMLVDRLGGRDTVPQLRLARAFSQLQKATSRTAVADLERSLWASRYTQEENASVAADLQLVRPAAVVAQDADSLRQRWAMMGLVGGLALSLVAAVLLERRSSRRHDQRPPG